MFKAEYNSEIDVLILENESVNNFEKNFEWNSVVFDVDEGNTVQGLEIVDFAERTVFSRSQLNKIFEADSFTQNLKFVGKKDKDMTKVDVDSHGRIYLPKEYRDEFGESFRIVRFQGELKLVPVPDDPVEDLRSRTEEIRESGKSVQELKEHARKELDEEAGE